MLELKVPCGFLGQMPEVWEEGLTESTGPALPLLCATSFVMTHIRASTSIVSAHRWVNTGQGTIGSEKTGHAEVVRVVYQPEHISFEELLKVFWENHDPTQGMRQGNDRGTQYRSAIYPTSAKQMEAALSSKEDYQKVLSEHGFGRITTDIREGQTFYYAEDYHQQYLSKNPNGYCGLGGTGVSCPVGIKK
nr:mitochondrial peptide methionine sulfoxide reductase isoform X7 [Symphalangus syndactylus]